MNRPTAVLTAVLVVFLALGATGCQEVSGKVKARPLTDSGFLKNSAAMQERTTDFPFQRYWCRGDVMQGFTQIKIAPVNTQYVQAQNFWNRLHPLKTNELKKDIPEIAAYMQAAFEKAVTNDPQQRFELVESVTVGTEILELALIQVVPSKAFFNAASKVGGFFAKGAGAAANLGQASVAMEGRVRDGATNEIVCMFADREKAKAAPIHLGDYTWYGNVHEIIDEWAKQWIEINNAADPVHEVKDTKPFTLRPW